MPVVQCATDRGQSNMPVGDEFREMHSHADAMPTTSKADQRRTNKPIMEKKRRARINRCLNELKSLILDAMKKDPARHSKLEKADILEMTVKHLQNVQRQQLAVAVAAEPAVLRRFESGFSECAGEVSRYVSSLDVDGGVKRRLSAHLSSCVSGIRQLGGPAGRGDDVNNNNNNDNNNGARSRLPLGLQLVPSRLASGELALLLPRGSPSPASSVASLDSHDDPAQHFLVSSTSAECRPDAGESPDAFPTYRTGFSRYEPGPRIETCTREEGHRFDRDRSDDRFMYADQRKRTRDEECPPEPEPERPEKRYAGGLLALASTSGPSRDAFPGPGRSGASTSDAPPDTRDMWRPW